MTKINILIAFIILLATACQDKSPDSGSSKEPECCFVEPAPPIKAILDSFIKVNGDEQPEHAIYIDKTSPHDYQLHIYAGSIPLTLGEDTLRHQQPLHKVRVGNVAFKVYSGAEHYFRSSHIPAVKETAHKIVPETTSIMWIVNDSLGRLTIYQTSGAYPFIAPPGKIDGNIKFKQPGLN